MYVCIYIYREIYMIVFTASRATAPGGTHSIITQCICRRICCARAQSEYTTSSSSSSSDSDITQPQSPPSVGEYGENPNLDAMIRWAI